MHYKIIGAPNKFKKWPRPLFRPKTNHTYHQKPHPTRETVPLILDERGNKPRDTPKAELLGILEEAWDEGGDLTV